MKMMFENVLQQFMSLSIFLQDFDLSATRIDLPELAKLNDILSETYILLNQGFCENITLCEKCVENRDTLARLTRLIDSCEGDQEMNEQSRTALIEFKGKIPEILSKMETIYLEQLQCIEN